MLPAHLRYLKCIPFSYPSQNPPLKTGGLTLPPPPPPTMPYLVGQTEMASVAGQSVPVFWRSLAKWLRVYLQWQRGEHRKLVQFVRCITKRSYWWEWAIKSGYDEWPGLVDKKRMSCNGSKLSEIERYMYVCVDIRNEVAAYCLNKLV